ncbi:hypothetical protein [Actinocorallia longicatena]|uniref:DUF2206 domain-containing protein n=1 Tax=Actinocorallia longicatena TaxID=111803 RepID=A0ABP6QIZ3_9ACTN
MSPRDRSGGSPLVTREDRRRGRSPLSTHPDLPIHRASNQTLVLGGLLMLMDALVVVRHVWAAQLVLVVLLLTLPGYLLLRALRMRSAAMTAFPLYIPAASLLVLLGSGLLVNLVGPMVGVAAPLRPVPLLVSLQIICAVLLVAGALAPSGSALRLNGLPPARWLTLPLLVPVLAAVGAIRLNTGHNMAVALTTLVLCVIALTVATAAADTLDFGRLSMILYVVALSMMWSFSLRSDLVYGFDIASEYGATHRTAMEGLWHAGDGDAYNAMLSITMLPAQIHSLTGITDAVVLKAVYPAIFAIFPVGVFRLAGRFVPRRWAFLAAAYVLVQGGIMKQLPALARQEIALLMFVALLGTVFDDKIGRTARAVLVSLFVGGMIVSHYSTAYLAVTVFGGALALQAVVSVVRRKRSVNLAVAGVFGAGLLIGAIWYVPVTHAAANLTSFGSLLDSKGFQFLPGLKDGNFVSAYMKGTETAGITAKDYQPKIAEEFRQHKAFVKPHADAAQKKYDLAARPLPKSPVLVPALRGLINTGELVAQQLGNLLGMIGALVVISRRKSPGPIRVIAQLALPALFMLALFRLSSTFATAYNQGRAQLQAMVILVIPLMWLITRLPLWVRRRSGARPASLVDRGLSTLTAGGLIVIFLNTCGFTGAFFGGDKAGNLSSSGEDYDRFSMKRPELAGAAWLGRKVEYDREFVYADRYAVLRVFAETTITDRVFTDVTPQTLDQHAWIYASRSNTVDGRARGQIDNSVSVYAFPTAFVHDHYNLVYSNGMSEVFHR